MGQILNSRIIRHAEISDMAEILSVFDAARRIMRASGNLHQWSEGYPSSEAVLSDIARGGAYLVCPSGGGISPADHRQVEAYFAMLPSPEPTYDKIYDGAWLDDSLPYHVIHRIASYPDSHGIFRDIIRFASAMDSNLRIDTHADNHIMQHLIMEYGFSYCGVIYLADGSPRLAYQRLSSGGQTTGGQASARKG